MEKIMSPWRVSAGFLGITLFTMLYPSLACKAKRSGGSSPVPAPTQENPAIPEAQVVAAADACLDSSGLQLTMPEEKPLTTAQVSQAGLKSIDVSKEARGYLLAFAVELDEESVDQLCRPRYLKYKFCDIRGNCQSGSSIGLADAVPVPLDMHDRVKMTEIRACFTDNCLKPGVKQNCSNIIYKSSSKSMTHRDPFGESLPHLDFSRDREEAVYQMFVERRKAQFSMLSNYLQLQGPARELLAATQQRENLSRDEEMQLHMARNAVNFPIATAALSINYGDKILEEAMAGGGNSDASDGPTQLALSQETLEDTGNAAELAELDVDACQAAASALPTVSTTEVETKVEVLESTKTLTATTTQIETQVTTVNNTETKTQTNTRTLYTLPNDETIPPMKIKSVDSSEWNDSVVVSERKKDKGRYRKFSCLYWNASANQFQQKKCNDQYRKWRIVVFTDDNRAILKYKDDTCITYPGRDADVAAVDATQGSCDSLEYENATGKGIFVLQDLQTTEDMYDQRGMNYYKDDPEKKRSVYRIKAADTEDCLFIDKDQALNFQSCFAGDVTKSYFLFDNTEEVRTNKEPKDDMDYFKRKNTAYRSALMALILAPVVAYVLTDIGRSALDKTYKVFPYTPVSPETSKQTWNSRRVFSIQRRYIASDGTNVMKYLAKDPDYGVKFFKNDGGKYTMTYQLDDTKAIQYFSFEQAKLTSTDAADDAVKADFKTKIEEITSSSKYSGLATEIKKVFFIDGDPSKAINTFTINEDGKVAGLEFMSTQKYIEDANGNRFVYGSVDGKAGGNKWFKAQRAGAFDPGPQSKLKGNFKYAVIGAVMVGAAIGIIADVAKSKLSSTTGSAFDRFSENNPQISQVNDNVIRLKERIDELDLQLADRLENAPDL